MPRILNQKVRFLGLRLMTLRDMTGYEMPHDRDTGKLGISRWGNTLSVAVGVCRLHMADTSQFTVVLKMQTAIGLIILCGDLTPHVSCFRTSVLVLDFRRWYTTA